MRKARTNFSVGMLRRTWALLRSHLPPARAIRREPARDHRYRFLDLFYRHRLLVRRAAIGAAIGAVLIAAPCGVLWWRLTSGPLALDLVTPWLTSAIEQRFGANRRVEVGGTQIERDEEGHAALRMRDIIVRDPDGTVVATAPKAEIGISGISLLTGHVQAKRLSLIGAAMALRIEVDGQITIFAGADAKPIATTPAMVEPLSGSRAGSARPSNPAGQPSAGAPAAASDGLAALLGWFDRLDALGLDGGDLVEVGLKSGSVVVDDRRNGKRLSFDNINLSLTRPKEGGVAFTINSNGADGAWSLATTVTPRGEGRRAIEAVIRDVSPKDLLLALRLDDGRLEADMPLSAVLRAEIGADGTLYNVDGRVLAGAGYVGEAGEIDSRISIDEAQFDLRWDPTNRQLIVPLEILSAGNRISLLGQIITPREPGGPWVIGVGRGQFVLGSGDRTREAPLLLDRVMIRTRVDPTKRRIEVEQGDISGAAASVAFSGVLDYSGAEARLTAGLAGTRMTASSLKRLWPAFLYRPLRNWVVDHIQSGTVERLVLAANAPVATLKPSGPPVPADGVSVEIVSNNAVVRPLDALPVVRDAELIVNVRGRNAVVRFNHGVAELPSGRKLNVNNGAFEVPDTFPKRPPARIRFRIDGPVDAAAELIAMEPLRDIASLQIDPATSRGTIGAQVTLGFPVGPGLDRNSVAYTVEADLTNFAAEKLVRSYKLESAALRINASHQQGVQAKGDVKIGGTPASIDYRKPNGNGDAEIRLQATLDDAARARLGFDLHGAISGPLIVKLNGRIGSSDRDSKYSVETDLTQTKVGDLLPGWIKPAGKSARAVFSLVDKGTSTKLEDIVIDGSGTLVKGSMELDPDGDVMLASFPVFGMSDGDKASLRAERAPDGTLKVTMRGDVYDGRGFVRGAFNGPTSEKTKAPARDLDLDIKVGAIAGHHGEALRGLDLRMARRAGQIRSFNMNAKLGRDSTLIGDLRGYANGRQVIYLETNDAGALFRFTDTYPKIFGGQMWVVIDPPNGESQSQDGLLNISNFSVRGEPALERVANTGASSGWNNNPGPQAPSAAGVAFSRMRVEFTRVPGKLSLREGVVWGPSIGATIEGQLDYAHDDVRMRGTFVPAYALNNMFARLPIVGMFMGGQNEGLLGVTYEVAGPPHAPVLRVNPISAVAPGFLRKLFEFRSTDDRAATSPSRRTE